MTFGESHLYFFTRDALGELSFKEKLKANGSLIDVGFNSCPEVVDWNEDGLLDLLVSMDSNGGGPTPIRLYLNSGTKSDYLFTNYTTLKAVGVEIKHSRCMICVYDLNSDGKKDLIVGESGGLINFYENIGSNSSPMLQKTGPIKSGGATIKLNGDTRLCVDDWNSDGAPDIIAGDYYDDLYLIKGVPKVTALKPQNVIKKLNPCLLKEIQRDFIVLSFSEPGSYNISIFDSSGKRLFVGEEYLNSGTNSISLGDIRFNNGLVFISVEKEGTVNYLKGFIR